MNYGLPYKGSKNRLAERIVRLLPKKKHLIDLFCGGCAVTHAALLKGKYEHIHINDLNWMCPTLFIDALAGKYDNETRWISRDDFFRLRDTDPYVAIVWSFGNNMRNYMYSREVEPLKRAIHYAIFFSDYAPGQDLGHDFSFVDGEPDVQKRYALIRRYFNGAMHSPLQALEGGGESEDAKRREPAAAQPPASAPGGAKRVSEIFFLGGHKYPQKQQNLWGMFRVADVRAKRSTWNATGGCTALPSPPSNKATGIKRTTAADQPDCSTANASEQWSKSGWGGQTPPLTSSVLDYADVEIPTDSVIYCDIPYEDTDRYQEGGFDFSRFYDWVCRQTEPVFISSYELPADRFECIAEYEHRCTFSQTANNPVAERIFIPRGQAERGNLPPRQLSLFG